MHGIHPESSIKVAMGAVFPNLKKKRSVAHYVGFD